MTTPGKTKLNGRAGKARAAKPPGIFTPKERLIYRYHDGQRNRLGDPLALLRALTTHADMDLAVDPKIALIPTAEGPKAIGRLVAAVREVFGVKPLDEGGLLEAECLALLADFAAFLMEVQRDVAPLPTSPHPTDCPPAGPSATASSSAAGSDGIAP